MYPLDPVAGLMITVSLAVLFAVAGVHKLRALAQFREVLRAYAVLPGFLVTPVSVSVPLLELAVALGLLVPVSRTGACIAGAALLALYATAMGVNLARGRRDLDCGCAGFDQRRPISAVMVIRNVILAGLLAAAGALTWSPRPLNWIDACTVAGGVAVASLLYVAIDALFEASRRLARSGAGHVHH